jgi:hypothetical protein
MPARKLSKLRKVNSHRKCNVTSVFVDANGGPEHLLDATRLAVEMLSDCRLAIRHDQT